MEGAPTQRQGRSKGAHLRLTLPAGTTKVSVGSHISCLHLLHNSCPISRMNSSNDAHSEIRLCSHQQQDVNPIVIDMYSTELKV